MNNIYEEINALASGTTSSVNQIEERDRFVDKFLTDYLNPEKLREKDSLREKIKFKHHQLETASKQTRKELKANNSENKKRSQLGKKPIINCKMKKSLGLFKLDPKSKLNYAEYEKMNELWKQYAYSSLMTCLPEHVNQAFALSEESVLNCLKQLDYHGCILTVTKSKVESHVGLNGIVLQEKKNSFFLLTKESDIKLIPKHSTLFQFELFQAIKFTLVGSNMCCKPELRSTKHARLKTKNVK